MRDIPPDLAPYSSDKPGQALHLLFLHHSCGGQLLADKGMIQEKYPGTCIYVSHPNGGSLRSALERNNYLVHEASYQSLLGQETDICSWRAKFRDHMEEILTCMGQDVFMGGGARNRVVVFKSCYPNSLIESDGTGPGNPDSAQRTIANYRAAYLALREMFAHHPDTLFVAFTAPPVARPARGVTGMARGMVRGLLGKPDVDQAAARRARTFNNWLKDMDHGWMYGYPLTNAVVFDYYDILTGYGMSDWSAYPTRGGLDSHANAEGNIRAARAFIPFLNMAVRRAGL